MNFKNGNLLTYLRSDGEYVNFLNNASVAATNHSDSIHLINGENSIDIIIYSTMRLNTINFSGSFDNTTFFWLQLENGDSSALPTNSRPHEFDSGASPINNAGGATVYYYTWKFRNVPPHIRFYNPESFSLTGIYLKYKTLK